MKKILAFILSITIPCVSFLGCGNSESNVKTTSETSTVDEDSKVTIDEYNENLKDVCLLMLTGAADAEDFGGLIHDVWYNCIYEVQDATTNPYTKAGAYNIFYDDFNDALESLFADEKSIETIAAIKDNQKQVENLMKDLKNPPEELEEAYTELKNYYTAYLTFTNLVISPTGNLQSYTQSFNEADEEVGNSYNLMKIYIE